MARAVPTVVHVGADVQSLVPAQFRSGGQGRQTLPPRAVAVTLFPMQSARFTANFVLGLGSGKMWPARKGSPPPGAAEAPLGLEAIRNYGDPPVPPQRPCRCHRDFAGLAAQFPNVINIPRFGAPRGVFSHHCLNFWSLRLGCKTF